MEVDVLKKCQRLFKNRSVVTGKEIKEKYEQKF
jgi:hypothetical protein